MGAIFYILRTGCQWDALPRSLDASSMLLYDPLGFRLYEPFSYVIRLKILYRVAIRNSFTILGNFLAVTCSPNILLKDEK